MIAKLFFLERALFEYYTKALFYSVFKAEASTALMSFPKQQLKLIQKMKYAPSRFLSEAQMKIVELAVDYNGDADFTDLRKRMVNESRFNRQYERATITFYLKQSRDRFNIHWIAPSQVVHGSVMDVLAAWKLEEAVDGSMSATGELESLMPFPNGALLDSCQFAVHTSLLVEEEFNLPESPERPPLLSKLVQALTEADSLDEALS